MKITRIYPWKPNQTILLRICKAAKGFIRIWIYKDLDPFLSTGGGEVRTYFDLSVHAVNMDVPKNQVSAVSLSDALIKPETINKDSATGYMKFLMSEHLALPRSMNV